MLDQGFQLLNMNDVDKQLTAIFRHWDASPTQRAELLGWAWVVAAASDFTASEDAVRAAEQLRDERDVLHRRLTHHLVETSVVDLELVSKRMFLDWLADTLHEGAMQPGLATTASRQ